MTPSSSHFFLRIFPILLTLLNSGESHADNLASESADQACSALSLEFINLSQLDPPTGFHSALWRLHQHEEIFQRTISCFNTTQDSSLKHLIRDQLSPCTDLREACKLIFQLSPNHSELSKSLHRTCKTCRLAESRNSIWTIFHSPPKDITTQDTAFRDELIGSPLYFSISTDRIDTALFRVYLKRIVRAISDSKGLDLATKTERIAQASGLTNGFSHPKPPGIIIKEMEPDTIRLLAKRYCQPCTTLTISGSTSIFPAARWWKRHLDSTSLFTLKAYQTLISTSPNDITKIATESIFTLERAYPYSPTFYSAYFPLDGSINGLLKQRFRTIYGSNLKAKPLDSTFSSFAFQYIKNGRDPEFKRILALTLCKSGNRKFDKLCENPP